ncbi:hypothetical protein FQN60_010650 [Etheostoma spectabile]|uniref:FH2 domain-containing protein n=1 Tax=Etheostoma spectabile TaxID=54343 RepID=A0A5J5CDD5_9PERO|nr:hypothetical protein FQN60_010650 [Etheostoma spectabile]
MNLPPDKVRLLRSYDNEKKWVREFLNEENRGLDVLVEYLSFAQYAVTFDGEQSDAGGDVSSIDSPWSRSIEDLHGDCSLPSPSSSVCSESMRFEKLMEHFKNEDDNIDFLFINIVVHSVEDMNFRVHLQYDFTKLYLDEHLERLKHTESDRLQVQIQAYLDNVFDVGTLLEDAETKTAALERVEELEENLATMSERLLDVENEAMLKIVELEKQLMQTNKELDHIRGVYASTSSTVTTLRRMVREKDQTIRRQTRLERQAQEAQQVGGPGAPQPPRGEGDGGVGDPETVAYHSLGPGMMGGAPGIMGGAPGMPAPPPPPPPPPMPGTAVKIKKPIQTKFRMPVLNWVALKPSQINGTVFNDIDDEAILQDLNVAEFEEMFKTKAQGPAVDLTLSRQKVPQKAPSKVSLLDANRSKNLAITLRKAGQGSEVICRAINNFDLRAVRVDFVECLMRFLPTDAEVKLLRQYERDRKPSPSHRGGKRQQQELLSELRRRQGKDSRHVYEGKGRSHRGHHHSSEDRPLHRPIGQTQLSLLL